MNIFLKKNVKLLIHICIQIRIHPNNHNNQMVVYHLHRKKHTHRRHKPASDHRDRETSPETYGYSHKLRWPGEETRRRGSMDI